MSNIKTIADIFTKLGTNIKHWQLMFREEKSSFTLIFDEGMGRNRRDICFCFRKQTSSYKLLLNRKSFSLCKKI